MKLMLTVSTLLVATVVTLLLTTVACQQKAPEPPDTRAADEQALRAKEAQWSKVSDAKDAAGLAAFYTADGVDMPPNEPTLVGQEAIQAGFKAHLGRPGFSSESQVGKVLVARGGDLGVTTGTYKMTVHDKKGKPVVDTGKWVTVYQKQPDGDWKTVFNISNSDLPLPKK